MHCPPHTLEPAIDPSSEGLRMDSTALRQAPTIKPHSQVADRVSAAQELLLCSIKEHIDSSLRDRFKQLQRHVDARFDALETSLVAPTAGQTNGAAQPAGDSDAQPAAVHGKRSWRPSGRALVSDDSMQTSSGADELAETVTLECVKEETQVTQEEIPEETQVFKKSVSVAKEAPPTHVPAAAPPQRTDRQRSAKTRSDESHIESLLTRMKNEHNSQCDVTPPLPPNTCRTATDRH